jgi:solute carrier family 6 (neurotransmitter transporter), invertebrate
VVSCELSDFSVSLQRIQLLYRPALNSEPAQRHPPLRRLQHPLPERTNPTIISLEAQLDDAPPKYTPPPSYTTATGARIAKMLRQSIRRSVRRIMGEGSRQQSGTTSIPPIDIPPPNYSSIISNDPATRAHAPISIINPRSDSDVAMGPRVLFNSETLGRRRSLNTDISNASTLTPRDVSQFLRPSQQATAQQAQESAASNVSHSLSLVRDTLRSSLTRARPTRSVENLVMAAAPLGDSSIINLADHRNYDDENVSVI